MGYSGRARMQHVKPPPKGKRGPGVSARAQYRRMAMEKAQANNKNDDVREGKVRDQIQNIVGYIIQKCNQKKHCCLKYLIVGVMVE